MPKDWKAPSIIFLTYYLMATCALLLSRGEHSLAVVWYANAAMGVYFAGQHLLTQSRLHWPKALFAVLFASLAADLPFSQNVLMSFMLAVANVFAVFLSAYLIRQHAALDRAMHSPKDFMIILSCTCLIAPGVSASLGATVVSLQGVDTLFEAWSSGFIGHLSGGISMTAIALAYTLIGPRVLVQRALNLGNLASIGIALIVSFVALQYLSFPYIYVAAILLLVALTSFEGMAISAIGISVSLSALIALGLEGFDASRQPHMPEVYSYIPLVLSFLPPMLLAVSMAATRRAKTEIVSIRRRAAQIYEKTPVAMHSIDDEGVITAVSDTWLDLLGYHRDDVVGQKSSVFLTKESQHRAIHEVLPTFFKTGRLDKVEYQFVKANGEILDIELSAILDTSSGVTRSFAVLGDVTLEKQLTQELSRDKELIEITLKSMGDGMVSTDTDGRISYLNPVAEQLIGIEQHEALGRKFEDVVMLCDVETQEVLPNPTAVKNQTGEQSRFSSTATLKSKTGDEFVVQQLVSPIIDKFNAVRGTVIVFQDITETRAISERMSYLAQHDVLTDLPNRLLLTDRLNHACSSHARTNHGFALLFMDLDNFKTINDTLGHNEGDKLLKVIAERLQSITRDNDTVCRLGGDEFIVLLEGVESSYDITRVCKQILNKINAPIWNERIEYSVTSSIGIAMCPKDGTDADTLMRRADAAMYRAKGLGRNTFSFYSSNLEQEASQRLKLEQDLRQAIETDQISIAYQPIIDAETQEVVYAEALCRWYDKDGHAVPPDVFIPVAEETRLINRLGQQLLAKVCKDIKVFVQQENAGYRKISVNISAVQLETPGFLKDVKRLLRTESIDSECLIFELTETSLMSDPDRSLKVMRKIRDLGIQIAIDDFGTGYSSLSYLKRYPVDILKIDREFVRDIEVDKQDKAFIKAIVSMAKVLDITVVAEGVETQKQARALTKMGCDYLQGYLFGKPGALQNKKPDSAENKSAIQSVNYDI